MIEVSLDRRKMIGESVGKYRLLEEIGRGAMGRVYKAQDTLLGRVVALKLIADKYMQDRQALARFEREGQATTALAHPNICTVFESGQWHGIPFLAMEYLEGINLTDRLKKGRLDGDELLHVAIPVASALAATHAIGVIHRDIKPANLFLTNRGEVKVLDFGLAKVHFRASAAIGEDMPTMATFATLPGTVLGTLAYMAPEQVRGEMVDSRADLYSFGVVLHEALTGALPVRGAPRAGIPEDLAPIIAKLIEIDREVRYQTAAEVHDALSHLRNLKAQVQSAG
jgi:eukaryotic-like serine/threonine-protein kinase